MFEKKRVTDAEILQEKLAECKKDLICTFTAAKFASIDQETYHCKTCTKNTHTRLFTICTSCYARCHKYHEVIKLGNLKCVCQCGYEYYEDTLRRKSQQLLDNEQNSNDDPVFREEDELCKCWVKDSQLLKQVFLSKFLPFPYEIVLQILSCLNGLQLAKLQLVNKTARTLVCINQQMWKNLWAKDFRAAGWLLGRTMKNKLKPKVHTLESSARDGSISWQEAYRIRIQWKYCSQCHSILRHDHNTKCQFVPKKAADLAEDRCASCGKKHAGKTRCGSHNEELAHAALIQFLME